MTGTVSLPGAWGPGEACENMVPSVLLGHFPSDPGASVLLLVSVKCYQAGLFPHHRKKKKKIPDPAQFLVRGAGVQAGKACCISGKGSLESVCLSCIICCGYLWKVGTAVPHFLFLQRRDFYP